MRSHASVVSIACCLALAAAPAPAATFYLTTGIGTNVTTIDPATPAVWNFSASETYSAFAGAVFAIKYDNNTNFGIQLELLDGSSMPLVGVSYANVVDYIQAGGSSEYTRFLFLIDTLGYALNAGFLYYVRLSLLGYGDPSDPSYGVAQSYSISGLDGSPQFRETNDPATIIVTEAVSVTATPEPASALLFAAGLLGLGLARRANSQAARHSAIGQT